MRKKAGKQGIAGAGIAVVPSTSWEKNEWELQPQSPVQTQTEPCDFAHPNPQPGLSQRLQSSFPNQREPQKRGDFPLWGSKPLRLRAFVMFFWQVLFIQEPDVGLRGCAAPASCFPANTGSTCPAQSWARPGEPGNCTGSARPGRGQGKTWHLPGPAQGHCCRELVLLMGQRSESGPGFLAVEWKKSPKPQHKNAKFQFRKRRW